MRSIMKRSLTLIALAGLSLSMHVHAERPNIIFFIADDMLPNHFNCLQKGKDEYLTPNIDRLAREGTLMLQQHVVSPVCTPSRYNVLTGNFGSRAQNLSLIHI